MIVWRTIRWGLGVLATTVICCADYEAAGTDLGPLDPPIPRTGSIMPLDAGTRWRYHHALRDSQGTVVEWDSNLDAEISRVYGVKSSGELVRHTWDTVDSSFNEYYSAFEWESTQRGWLLVYRDLDVTVPGVYVVGEYFHDSLTVYASPTLLLAYPAEPGYSWTTNIDSAGMTMTLLSTDTTAHCAVEGASTAPVSFLSCHLYRCEAASEVSYHFYHEDYGEIAAQHYRHGRLVKSYVLTEFFTPSR